MKIYIISFLVLILCSGLYAQKPVSGIIKDSSGEPLSGATVIVKDQGVGTITNANGEFTLKSVKESDVLICSSLGYLTQEVTIGSNINLNIKLNTDTFQMEGVVVVGYGSVGRKGLTGSVGSVSAKDIMRTATSNYDQALAGRVAGVQVSSVDGTPGDGLNIVIRGGNSITGDNSPLYVVDGIPMENFDPGTISSADIASLDILKDASSAAIYGSRGANGVVLITTKSGKADGRTTINVRASFGMSWIPTRIEMMGAYDYVRYQQEVAYATDGYTPSDKVKQFIKTWGSPELYKGKKGTSWQDEIFRTAKMRQAFVSISGGNKNTSIYYSGDYTDQQGTMLNTNFKKLVNNLKITQSIGSKTKLTGQLMFIHTDRRGINIAGNTYNSIIRDALQYRPIEPINGDGLEEGGYDPDDSSNRYMFNPVKSLENTDRVNRANVVRGVTSLERKFGKKWVLNLSGNFQVSDTKQSIFYGLDTQQGTTGTDGSNGSITNTRSFTLSTSNTLKYSHEIHGHTIGALVGFEATDRLDERGVAKNTQFPTDIFGIDKMGIATSPVIATSSVGENTLASFFGRVNYDYVNKYYLTVNFRADGSSKFAKNNRWGYFPSVSGAWRMSEEKFLKNKKWLSNMKLFGGWGLTGNNRIGNYDHISYLDINSNSGYVWGVGEKYIPGTIQANMGVPDLTWETTSQTSGGVDFSFLQNKIQLITEIYYKKTTDLLLNADMALSTGFEKVQQNVGSVSNKGLELTLNTVNMDRKNFKWYSSFNISFNRNKVLKLNHGQQAIYTDPTFYNNYSEYAYISEVGKPVGMIYGLQYDGLYTWDDFNYDSGTGTFSRKPGVPDNGSTVSPGSLKYVDQNNDGTINQLDRVIIGNPHPKHFGGFTNDFVIAGDFDVQIFFQWSYGSKILNATKSVISIAESKRYNLQGGATNFWSPYNTNSSEINAIRYESIFGAAPKGNNIDSRSIEDGSYLKLKSITIGYTLPKIIASKISMSKVRFYVSANNILTFTKYSGFDPDVSVGKYGALTPALDFSVYPQSLTVQGGIEFTF